MGLLNWLLPKPIVEERRHPPDNPDAVRVFINPSAGGVFVNHDIALTYSAFWAAVRVISETVAQLPWHTFRVTEDGSERLHAHNLQRMLNVQTNPETDAFTWRTVMLGWVLTWGNAYAEIQRDRQGRVIAFWQVPPDRVDIGRDELGGVVYRVRNPTTADAFIPAADMLHVKGLGWDGQKGYSVVGYHIETISGALAQNRYATNFIDGAAVPAGVLTNERMMSPQAKENWIDAFKKSHQGAGKKRQLLIVDEGMSYQAIGVPPETAQLIENKRFSVLDISRIFGVAPHDLGEMEHATFSNIEEQNRSGAVRWTIPWSMRMSAAVNTKVLTGNVRTKHILQALLRADLSTRFSAYAIGIQNGWLSPNDVRSFEDQNPIPDGDLYVMQGQMMTLEDVANPPEPAPPPVPPPVAQPQGDDDEDDETESNDVSSNQRQAFVDLLGDVFRRACRRAHHRIAEGGTADKIMADHHRYLSKELTGPAESIYGAMAPDMDRRTVDVLVRLTACEFYDKSRAELEQADDAAAASGAWAGTRAQDAASALFDELRTVAYARL